MPSDLRNIKASAVLGLASCVALTALGGCATTPTPDRTPTWAKSMVAGSRIPRRLDSFGNPATGTLVQVITDDNLQTMPGNSLGDKLSGNPGGI